MAGHFIVVWYILKQESECEVPFYVVFICVNELTKNVHLQFVTYFSCCVFGQLLAKEGIQNLVFRIIYLLWTQEGAMPKLIGKTGESTGDNIVLNFVGQITK